MRTRIILQSQLDNVHAVLKSFSIKWIDQVIVRIQNDKKLLPVYRDNISKTKIYNVLNNVVRDQQWKIIVYKEMLKLKDELSAEVLLINSYESNATRKEELTHQLFILIEKKQWSEDESKEARSILTEIEKLNLCA